MDAAFETSLPWAPNPDVARLAKGAVSPALVDQGGHGRVVTSGPQAICEYLEDEGGARLFMRQKGIRPEALDAMEQALGRFASAAGARAAADTPGAGAAGGIGFALVALGGTLASGAETVLDLVDLDSALAGADLLITGEGSFDAQSLVGKATGTALERARARSVPTAVICGQGALAGYEVRAIGTGLPLEEAMRRAPELIEAAAADLTRSVLRSRQH